jgi:hypothetical protein
MKLPIVILAFSLLSTTAFAQQETQSSRMPPNAAGQPPTAQPAAPSVDIGVIFDKLNTSHDGRLTRDQAQSQPTVAANFDAADANKDGVLTKDEFMAAFRPQ